MRRVTEKWGADLMKITAEMRCALTIITGAVYVLTHSKQPKKASRFLRVLDEGLERLTRAVCAAEELAKTLQEGSVPVDVGEGG